MGKYKLFISLLVAMASLPACQANVQVPIQQENRLQSFNAQSLSSIVLKPSEIPEHIVKSTLKPAQDFADKTSKRRKIEFFNLHANPMALQIGKDDQAIYMLSYLGTAKTRNDLNVELRAIHSSFQQGFSLNYSGPVTWSGHQEIPQHFSNNTSRLTFELIMGLPGSGYTRSYERYLEALSTHLKRRYQSRPFTFNDSPFVYAIKAGNELKGFVFSNQHNRLILGERKYADVQNVVYIGQNRSVKAAYTLIGFNQKTSRPTSQPEYRFETSQRLGTLVQFGDL